MKKKRVEEGKSKREKENVTVNKKNEEEKTEVNKKENEITDENIQKRQRQTRKWRRA